MNRMQRERKDHCLVPGLIAVVLLAGAAHAGAEIVFVDLDDLPVAEADAGIVIEERNESDVVVRQIVYGGGRPLWQILSDGSAQYLHVDPRGNVVALTEATGTPGVTPGDVLERFTYDAYGKPLLQDANNQDKTDPFSGRLLAQSELDNDLLFRGMVYDPETGERGFASGSDFGGLYCGTGRYLDPDDGRFLTRVFGGDPDRPVITGRAANAGAYGFADHAPVNVATTGSARPTGRRTHEPFRIVKYVAGESSTVRKKPGRLKYTDITLKRGSLSTGGTAPTDIGVVEDEPQPLCCKEKFVRDKPHLNAIPGGPDSEDIGAPDLHGGPDSEDIGAPAPSSSPEQNEGIFGCVAWSMNPVVSTRSGGPCRVGSTPTAIAIPNLLDARKDANE